MPYSAVNTLKSHLLAPSYDIHSDPSTPANVMKCKESNPIRPIRDHGRGTELTFHQQNRPSGDGDPIAAVTLANGTQPQPAAPPVRLGLDYWGHCA